MPNTFGLMDCTLGEFPKDERQRIVFTTRFERNSKANFDLKANKWIVDKHGLEDDEVKVLCWIELPEEVKVIEETKIEETKIENEKSDSVE